MSDSAPLGNLPIYTARTWTTGESMTRTKFQSEFDQAEALLTLCKTALADIQNRRHGGSAPTENAIAGQIWAKKISAARTQWFGDPDGAGADDPFLTENEAYNADAKTAGTGTFKVGGPVNVDAAVANADYYTVPANTLDTDKKSMFFVGSKSAAQSSFAALWWGTAPTQIAAHSIGSTGKEVIQEAFIIRTAAGAQKFVSCSKWSVDNSGSTTLVSTGSTSEDETTALKIGMSVNTVGEEGASITGFVNV